MVINDYQMCKKFKVLPTAPTLYQEKARTVIMFQIIDSVIAEEEAKENNKQQKKGGKK
jgi:hypothetical protein